MRLRIPFQIRASWLRVALYGRYSTDDQNPSSIPDQFAYCEKPLAEAGVLDKATIERFYDEGVSGEIVSRPGINRLRDDIDKRRFDVLIVEDASRLFRHDSECLVMVETAVDQGVRVICINDDVDTAEPDWEDCLFQSTLPRGERPFNRFAIFDELMFQSTLPRGERPKL